MLHSLAEPRPTGNLTETTGDRGLWSPPIIPEHVANGLAHREILVAAYGAAPCSLRRHVSDVVAIQAHLANAKGSGLILPEERV
jgi:hypothetical protein